LKVYRQDWCAHVRAGNLRFKVRNGQTIEYQYDLLGRLTDIIYRDPAQNVAMTYDSGAGANLIGRLASVSDPSGLVQYSYNDQGNLESETRTVNGIIFVTGYGYYDGGNLRTMTYPTGQSIAFLPDAADPARIGAVTLNGTQTLASNLVYKPFGPLAAMTLGNGIQQSRTFDKNYQISAISAGAILNRTYTPDNVGNIKLISDQLDSTRSQSFDYDDLYRLSRTRTGASAAQDSYHYYAGTNRLQTVTGDHAELIQYDADGNTTSRIPGAANPIPAITDPADYTYNSSGQRAIKDAANDVIYHYDLSGQLIAETDATGTMLKAYVWLHGQPLAMINGAGDVYYYHNDHLGTPQRMTDASANVVWSADYLPFGQANVNVALVENNLRFAGQYYDAETGLHYNYHRYYDPKLGRYLRADPIGLIGGLNLYSYVSNEPIRRIDPFGLRNPFGIPFGARLPTGKFLFEEEGRYIYKKIEASAKYCGCVANCWAIVLIGEGITSGGTGAVQGGIKIISNYAPTLNALKKLAKAYAKAGTAGTFLSAVSAAQAAWCTVSCKK
jgi:RHS repeat-associated protein